MLSENVESVELLSGETGSQSIKVKLNQNKEWKLLITPQVMKSLRQQKSKGVFQFNVGRVIREYAVKETW